MTESHQDFRVRQRDMIAKHLEEYQKHFMERQVRSGDAFLGESYEGFIKRRNFEERCAKIEQRELRNLK